MKVYFGCSTSQFDKYHKHYFAIRDYIVEQGHILTRDWLQIYRKELVEAPEKLLISRKGPKAVYKKAMKAFYEADVFIAENTVPSFSNGHLMTLALQRKMPVLILQLSSRPKRYLKRSFIEGIESDYFEFSEYTTKNYKDEIKKFLRKFEDSSKKHRFHLVIDDVERRYLEWAKFKKSKSQTQLIREGIRDLLDNDKEYKKYLGS